MQEELFEWILIIGKREYCLTEKQYMLFREAEGKIIMFDTFAINPRYVSAAYRQKAYRLKKMYPCAVCQGVGNIYQDGEDEVVQSRCDNCQGTGIDLTAKPAILPYLLEEGEGAA